LALYSSTNALFSIGQQVVVNRMKDTVGEAADKAATGRVAKNVTPRRRK
jgi:membrane protein insertase Oxa1/YidC/SpoIIIJ